MTSDIKKINDYSLDVSVELDATDLEKYIKLTESDLAKNASMDGFRPGKVPPEVLRKNVDENALRQEALQKAVEMSLAQLASDEKIEVVDQEKFEIKENSKDKLKYQVRLICIPELELKDYKGNTVEKKSVVIKDQDVDKVVGDLLKSRTTFHEEDRPVKEGDRVEVDFEIKHKEKLIEGGKSENHPLIIGEDRFAPGFEEKLVGMKKGEDKSFSLDIPKDYYQKTIAGKKIDVSVAIKKIERKEEPAFDDEFAKTVGAFDSTTALKDSIKEGLKQENERKEESRVRVELLGKIIEKNKFDVPDVLIDRQLKNMVSEFDGELHRRGMELGPYLTHIKKTQDDLKKEWRPQAVKQVQMELVIKSVAKIEKIRVGEVAVQEQLELAMKQSMAQGMNEEALKQIDVARTKTRIYASLLSDKVFEFLLKNNEITSKT